MEINAQDLYIRSVFLNLTDSCNYACRYCFVAQQPHFMPLNIAKQGVEFLISELDRQKIETGKEEKGRITFFGGEPTLCYDTIIVPLVEWIEETYPGRVTFGMTSNMSLLNEERYKWLHEHKVGLHFSCDGDEETQNYNRPCRDSSCSSFDLVNANIPYILKYNPNITFRGTIIPDTCHLLYHNYKFAMEKGFKNSFFIPNHREQWPAEKTKLLKEELSKIYHYYRGCFLLGKKPQMSFSPFDKLITKRIRSGVILNQNRRWKRCGMGTGSVSINYEGDIFACQEQDSYGFENIFHIGNLKTGIDNSLREKLITTYIEQSQIACEKPVRCLTCTVRDCCNLFCPSTIYDVYGRFDVAPEIGCMWQQWLQNMTDKLYTEFKNDPYFISLYTPNGKKRG